MKSTPIAQYTQPHQFEPLLPQTGLDSLRERSRAVIEQSLRLSGAVHPDTIATLRELVREMVESDLKIAQRDAHVTRGGFRAPNFHE